MSALIDDLPVVPLPPRVRRRPALRLVEPGAGALAPTAFVGAPNRRPERSVAAERPAIATPHVSLDVAVTPAPLRLTRRGLVVLSTAVAVLAAGLIGVAWLSAPAGAGRAPVSTVVGNTVAVAPGDSLWSIAGRVAPNLDPRAEVAELQRLNHLAGSGLVPGQVLRVH